MTRADSLRILKAAGCTPGQAAAAIAVEEQLDYSGTFSGDDSVSEFVDEDFERLAIGGRRC